MIAIGLNIFIPLLTSHILADFIFQTNEDVQTKTNPAVFAKHLFIVSITSYILLGIWTSWLLIPVVFIIHGVIDLLKLALINRFSKQRFALFAADQVIHAVSLMLTAYVLSNSYPELYWQNVFGSIYNLILIIVSVFIITTITGGIAVGLFVKPFVEQLENFDGRGFINGGKMIGYLERFLVVLFVFTGNFSGVGFLIAAKSIFRFGELFNSNNRKEAEYIIIGTFFSFSYAILTGFILHASINNL